MVKYAYRKLLVLPVALLSFACNFEIGNPEPPPPTGKIDHINLSLSHYSPCSDNLSTCTSVPVKLAGTNSPTYSMEMTSIRLRLENIQLAPFAQQSVNNAVDLLSGTRVALLSELNAREITNASLMFTSAGKSTFEIQGQLRVSTPTETFTVPLTLSDTDSISAQSDLPQNDGATVALLFDAEAWFDFTSDSPEISNILRNLTSGPCRTGDSTQCQNFRNQLAKQISRKVGRSMSAIRDNNGVRRNQDK